MLLQLLGRKMAKAIKQSVVINDEFHTFVISDEQSATRRRRKESSIPRASSSAPSTKKAKTNEQTPEPVPESSATCSISLKPLDNENEENMVWYYKLELMQHKAVMPVDDSYLAFMLQDYNLSSRTFKDGYEIVSRRGFISPEGPRILYMCSCNVARRRMIDNLPVGASVDTDFEGPYQECVHTLVMKQLAEEFDEEHNISAQTLINSGSQTKDRDDHSYDKTSPEVMVYGIENHDQVLCVTMKGGFTTTYTIVRVDFSGQKQALKCSTCKQSDCEHCKAVLTDYINPDRLLLDSLKSETKWRSRYVPVSVSKQKIPFVNVTKSSRPSRDLSANGSGSCPDCQSSWSTEVEAGEEVKIYTRCEVFTVTVHRRHCSNPECMTIKEYDGAEDQLLNMGSYLVDHDVLRSYLRQYVTEGTTMASFYKEWTWMQIDNGNWSFSEEFSYNRFRFSWYYFLHLLDIQYTEGFACPECGDSPETVVMDGVSLGIRKTYMPWSKFLEANVSSSCLDGSSHNNRVFVNNQKARTLLTKYATTGVSREQVAELKRSLGLYQPVLLRLLNSFISEGYETKCPVVYADFLVCLGSDFPVCGLIHHHPGFVDMLRDVAAGIDVTTDPNNFILLEQQCPVLADLLHKLKWDISVYLRDIIGELIVKAEAPFINKDIHDIPLCDDSCTCTGTGYFPTLTKHSHRGDYILDDKKKEMAGGCTKRSSSHKTLTPGLFTLSCVHGICYGFQVMENVESPNTPFTILRTRFHTAPKMIIYDNACNLHRYCLNRDPVFFRDTWFVVDRFHWCNHVGCHLGYCLDLYLQYRNLNSQVAEQRNATLKKLKSMLSYMSLENFNNHLKLFFWFRSMMSISSIAPNLPLESIPFFKRLSVVYSKYKTA